MSYTIPPYPHAHAGTAIVLGSAACAPEDLRRARVARGDCPIIGVNDASKLTPLDHLFSLHVEFLAGWKREQLERFGRRPLVHTAERVRKGEERSDYPDVDYWWVGTHGGATSAWSAVRMAKRMGFDEVILAGCPLQGVGYCVDPRPNPDSKSLGAVADDDPLLKRFRRRFHEYAVEEGEGEGVRSMSGYTRELLGAP